MKVEIRSTGSSNLDEICTIHNKGFSELIDSLGILYGYHVITNTDIDRWLENDNAKFLVAYENEIPIGYLQYQIVKMKGVRKDITCLEIVETTEGRGQSKFVVIPEHRGKGVGMKLLLYVLGISKEQNIDVVIIYAYNHNLAMNNILQELGFVHKPVFYYPPFSTSKPIGHDSVLAEFNLLKEIPVLQNRILDEIHIREFQPKDIVEIQQIFIECRPDMLENLSESEIGNHWLKENWAAKTLVAECQGKVVGCMEYNQYGLIGIPGIKKKFQKRGIGARLLLEILQDMKSIGYTKALADTGVILPDAINLYRRLGFNLNRELWAWVKII